MRKDDGSGCLGFFVLICFAIGLIYTGIDNWIHSDEIEAEEKQKKQEFVDFWKQSNINFFSKFKCNSSLSYDESKSIKIDKFYIFDTNQEYECNIKDFHQTKINFKKSDLFNFISEEIKNANVLIWVKQVPGEQVGSYGDGSRAIRLNAEINFINISENTIYKKITVPCIGEPQKEIYKKGYTSPSKNFYFGSLPYDNITKIIKKEIEN